MFNLVESVSFHFALEKSFKNKTSDRKKRTHCRFLNYHPPAKLREGNVFSRYQIIYQTIIKCLGTPSHIDLHAPPTWEPYHHPSTHMGTSPQRDPHLPTHMWTLPEGPRSPTHTWTLPQGPPSPTHMGTLPPSIYSHGDLTTEGTPISLPTWGPYHRDPIPHPHGDLTTGTPSPTHMGTLLPSPYSHGDLTTGTPHLPYPHVDLTTQGPHPPATRGPYHHPLLTWGPNYRGTPPSPLSTCGPYHTGTPSTWGPYHHPPPT